METIADLTAKIKGTRGRSFVGEGVLGILSQFCGFTEVTLIESLFARKHVHVVVATPFEHDFGAHFGSCFRCLHVEFPINV